MVAILITAGPTREYLDDVRFLSNGSTGRMGCALAQAALETGNEVYLVLGPVAVEPPAGVHLRRVETALEMESAASECFEQCDIAIGAAAVSDWRPAERRQGKPPRGDRSTLQLIPNPDIIGGLGARKGARVVVGFALAERGATIEEAVARGRAKLLDKKLDLVVCNCAEAIGGAGSEVALLYESGAQVELPHQDKSLTAAAIIAAAVGLCDGGRRGQGAEDTNGQEGQ